MHELQRIFMHENKLPDIQNDLLNPDNFVGFFLIAPYANELVAYLKRSRNSWDCS